jgi:hypothetical protein
MPVKVKEMKDDDILEIKVNKNFYMMSKALSFYLFNQMHEKNPDDNYLKDTLSKKYEELDDLQRSFYTIALLLAEIETQAKNTDNYVEKEVLVPGDEGFVAPSVD